MGKISSFITGAAIGFAAALLLAPRTGEESRAFVTEKANAIVDEAKDFASGLPGSATSAFKGVCDKGAAAVKGAPAKANGTASKAAPADSDELREKIEAARKRIAAQVMENAEQSKTVEVATA